MDVVIGSSVSLRPVAVRVGFPDSIPMSWAELRVNEDPIEANREPWGLVQSTQKGVAHFEAPVDLNLRIKIRDDYGLELKITYVSTHPAGVEPIQQEFVIHP